MIRKPSYLLIVTFFLMVTIQGCAVLTDDQVQAVHDFAKAGQDYTDLPSAVIETHAEIMYLDNVYETATTDSANIESVPQQLDKAVKNRNDFLAQAKQTDETLKVIDTYISLLTTLTSDVFTEQLAVQAVELGEELDDAVDVYNDNISSDQNKIDGWGKYVAAGIRGAGGIFIKNKQTKALQQAVTHAQPQIANMAEVITDFMETYSSILGPMAVEGLTDTYMTLITNDISKNSVASLENFSQAREKARSIKILSEKSILAIQAFQAAHSALYENLQEKRSIKGTIGEIKSLASEIKSAQELMKDFE